MDAFLKWIGLITVVTALTSAVWWTWSVAHGVCATAYCFSIGVIIAATLLTLHQERTRSRKP
jgi:hypothetical protein